MKGTRLLLATAICFACHASLAQPAVELKGIVVEATRLEEPAARIPYAAGSVTETDIQAGQQQLSLDESMKRIPGVFLQNPYNYAQDQRISIRGFGARANFGIRGIKILVDGIPSTLPDGQGEVDSIDLGSAGRIDVLRGAASSLHGNASGGVISITSEEAPEHPFAELRGAWGEFGYQKYQAKTGGRSRRLGYLLGAGDLRMDGYRDHSRVENTNLNSKFTYDINESSDLSIVVNAFDSPVAEDAGSLNEEQVLEDRTQANPLNLRFDAGESISQEKIGLRYQNRLDESQALTARLYGTQREFDGRLPFQSGGAVQLDRAFYGGGLQYVSSARLKNLQNRFIAGIDLDLQDDDRLRFDNNNGVRGDLTLDQTETVSSVGLFVQDELALNSSTTLTLGGRLDVIEFDVEDRFLSDGDDSGERKFEEFSPMIGLVWAATDSLNLYANVSTAFETPTTTELADPSGGGGFNPDLQPQKATNYEVGMKGFYPGTDLRYELALFHIDVRDEITPFELPGSPGRTFFRNAGRSTRDGIEATIAVEPVTGLMLSLSYTYSDFTFDEFEVDGNDFAGNRIPGVPEHLFNATLEYRRGGGFVVADYLYVGELFADNANRTQVDAYGVVNLRAGYERAFGDWLITPFLGVNNLFDERYNANIRINAFGGRYFEPAPDRNIYGGLTVRKRFR